MEIVRQKITDLLDLLEPSEALQFIEEERARLGNKLRINESKLTNGTQGERVVCREAGLRWNASHVHGCDAWDSHDRPVEIKVFKYKAGGRANINYTFGEAKKNETRAQHAKRVRKNLLEITGGHYWAQTTHGHTRLAAYWKVPCKAFAYAVEHYMLAYPDRKKLNLGATYCKTCQMSHRVVAISKILRTHDPKKWRFPERVAQNCT